MAQQWNVHPDCGGSALCVVQYRSQGQQTLALSNRLW
jgi:hypothetical protein